MKTERSFLLLPDNEAHQELCLSVILVLQVLTIFIAAPLIGGSHHWIINVFLTAMALTSVFTVSRGIKRRLALASFALCLTGLVLGPMLIQRYTSQIIITVSGLLFCANVSWIVANRVFSDGAVTLHRIRGAVVIYLNIALSFALVDCLMAIFIPEAYSGLPKSIDDTMGSMIYFSLTTLTTTGYGDLVAVYPFARSLATLEAVIGQFYMGTLIATLVGLHVSNRQNHTPK